MIDIDTAREKVLNQERLRPGPGQFSALWEHGESWWQAFSELVAAEHARDTLFEQLLDGATSFEARRERLQEWSSGLQASQAWHEQLASALRQHQQLWNTDERGQPLAPNELSSHQALLDLRISAGIARRALLDLEYLEYRRRSDGRLDESEWQRAWSQLLAAFRQQASVYKQWFAAGLPDEQYAERLRWCLRLQRLQNGTHAWWADRRDADRAGLMRDAATVSQLLESLYQASEPKGNPLMVLVVAAVVIAMFGFMLSGGGATSPAAPPPSEVAAAGLTAPAQAVAPMAGDRDTPNEEGKRLLKQGRCEAAIERFQAAFDANPSAHEAYEPLDNMAFCLYELGRNDEAIARWQQALAIEPNSPDANAGLGMALYLSGRRDDAIRYYRNALRLKAEYADEEWLRSVALWSERAIADSRELRNASIP